MDSNTRKFLILGSAVLVAFLGVGLGVKSVLGSKKQNPSAQSTYPQMPPGYPLPTGVNMPAGMTMPAGMAIPAGVKLPRTVMLAFGNILPPGLILDASEQQAVNKLTSEQHLTRRAAAYLVKSKIQLIGESKTSLQILMTFPDGVTIDETIDLHPNQAYSRTPADLERAAHVQHRIYNPRLSVQKKSADSMQATLEYNVPYSALPKELRERVEASSARPSAEFFTLVPPAWGQARSVAEPSLTVAANVLAEHWKGVSKATGEEFETLKSLGADVPLAIFDLFMSMSELGDQLDAIGNLQDCANNPTNPLTQKATQDPNYQHDVLDQLSDAKSDVGSSALPRVANVAAGYLTHFLPFGSGAALAPILGMNDDAINSINEQRINDAEKLVVECEKDEPMPSFGFRAMAGKFEYLYSDAYRHCNENGCNFNKTARDGSGTFLIDPNATEASAAANDIGAGSEKADGGTENSKCHSETHTAMQGPLKVSVEVGGTPESAILRLAFGSNEWKGTTDSSQTCGLMPPVHQEWDNGSPAAVECKFTKVDMIKGGHYATFSEADRGRGTCTIDLERK